MKFSLIFLNFLLIFSNAYDLQKCTICKYITSGLSKIESSQVTQQIVEKYGVPVCKMINGSHNCDNDSCDDLCHGIIREFAPVYLKMLNDSLVSHAFCSQLNLCPPQPAPKVSDLPQIKSNLSDFSGERKWQSWNNDSGTGYFVHFTDIHIDRLYREYSNSNCSLPLCCREQEGDIKMNASSKYAAGYWGTLDAPCDIPIRTLEHVHRWFQSLPNQPDFVINTGDNPAHDIWAQSQKLNMEATETVIQYQRQAFGEIPVMSSLGNHEFYPIGQATGSHDLDEWLYQGTSDLWSDWLANDAIKTASWGGYYASRARPKLRIVSLSTTTLTDDPFYHQDLLMGPWPDPLTQMAWLNNTLQQCSQRGEKVILIGHHRYGDWDDKVIEVMVEIISNYQNMIVLQLFGHGHMNEFGVTSTKNGTLLYPWFMGGSLTTTGVGSVENMAQSGCGVSGNPGFTIYRYDRETLEIEDVEYWWADLRKTDKNTPPDWQMQYSAKQVYNMKDMSVESWEKVGQQLFSNSTMKKNYNTIWIKGLY